MNAKLLGTCGLLLLSNLPLTAAITVTLTPSVASPRPVGTPVLWTAMVNDTQPGTRDFRFTVRQAGGPVQIKRDFAADNTWSWAHSFFEGTFTIGVVVRNRTSGESAFAFANYTLTSRLAAGLATVNATRNPLVALFSAPACLAPNTMRVRFRRTGDPATQLTNAVPCRASTSSSPPDLTSMNFYVAGMYPSTTYAMRWEVTNPAGAVVGEGVEYPFTTGSIPATVTIPTSTVTVPPPPSSFMQPIILLDFLNRLVPPVNVAATDLEGRALWYLEETGVSIDRVNGDGTLMGRKKGVTAAQSTIQEIDLAGNVLLETTVARVSEQLVAMGQRRIVNFSHEIRRIFNPGRPNHGYLLVIAGTDYISTQHQGGTPEDPVDILGDAFIVLDRNLQVSWAWDPFEHLDLNRPAVLGEICTPTTICRPYSPGFTRANDWMHTNSLQYTPWDGNLIASLRSQDWVIKVNYDDGAGDGSIVWRMGEGGDFSITTVTSETTADIGFPWFSHQHDADFELRGAIFGGRRVMTIYDNGNTRRVRFNPSARSRCQSYAVDEANLTVNLNINADVGVYAEALGSAELLANGNLSCTSGSRAPTVITENDKNGNLVYVIEPNTFTYRSFRLRDLYTPGTL